MRMARCAGLLGLLKNNLTNTVGAPIIDAAKAGDVRRAVPLGQQEREEENEFVGGESSPFVGCPNMQRRDSFLKIHLCLLMFLFLHHWINFSLKIIVHSSC